MNIRVLNFTTAKLSQPLQFFLSRAGSEGTNGMSLKLNYFIRKIILRVVRPNL